MLKSYIPSFIKYNWILGLVLIVLFTIVRFILVIDAYVTKSYSIASFVFLAMIILPFILLNKEGRRYIGICKPKRASWLIPSFIVGLVIASVIYLLFTLLYGDTISNSYVYISQSYFLEGLNDSNRLAIFLAFCMSGMTFSPFGEELFYRGVIHGSFVQEFGERKASIYDSLAFAFAHLSHFGIIYTVTGGLSFLPLPALLWFCCMYILSRISFFCKQKTGFILGPIVVHAGFNISMLYWIFYYVL